MRKNPRIEIILNLFFGISSLLGFIITIVFTIVALQNNPEVSFNSIIITLGITTAILTLVFVFMAFYYIFLKTRRQMKKI